MSRFATALIVSERLHIPALVRMLLNQVGIVTALEAEDTTEAVALAERHQPDVLLFDLSTPASSAGEAIGRLRQVRPNPTVLVIASQSVRDASSIALKLGAVGYLEEKGSTADALRTLRETLDGLSMGISKGESENARGE